MFFLSFFFVYLHISLPFLIESRHFQATEISSKMVNGCRVRWTCIKKTDLYYIFKVNFFFFFRIRNVQNSFRVCVYPVLLYLLRRVSLTRRKKKKEGKRGKKKIGNFTVTEEKSRWSCSSRRAVFQFPSIRGSHMRDSRINAINIYT